MPSSANSNALKRLKRGELLKNAIIAVAGKCDITGKQMNVESIKPKSRKVARGLGQIHNVEYS